MGLGSGNPWKTGVAWGLRGHLGNRYGVPSRAGCSDIAYRPRQTYRDPSHNSKTVLSTVKKGPPTSTVDTTIFEMWLGRLSTHQGLSTPVD